MNKMIAFMGAGMLGLLVLGFVSPIRAQQRLNKLQVKEVHVVNNVGWGVPLGATSELLTARYSSSLGLDVALVNERYFLYPFLDFLSFRYDQQAFDPEVAYRIENGRSKLYTLNLAAGMRKRNDRWGIYGFAGPGVGLMTEPRAVVQAADDLVVLRNKQIWGPTLRGGAGADYRMGNIFIFVECGYLYQFRRVQARPVHVLSVYGGLKTNVTRVADKVIEILGD